MCYFGFESAEDMCASFRIDQDMLSGVKILVACYDEWDYEGHAFVLYESEGRLFEVNAGHCSCYGLEDQWEPEETSWQALKFRLENGSSYFGGAREHLIDLIPSGV